MRRVLVILASPPGSSARDGIDAALAAVAYDHPVSVMLVGDGVSLVVPSQQPQLHGQPDLLRGLAALVHHGVDEVIASAACLRARGVGETGIALRALESPQLAACIAEYRHVLSF